ncbi:MAG TPA: four helix bundle protein [Patescibacteria group bacterium]|nr:four helix bundle protein [Patescibacteria group bacterium]
MAMGFEDLKVWQKAHRLMLEIYKLTAKFPRSECYSLIDQLRRAAISVCANIAEAHGRHHYLDKTKFLYNARGSIEETRSHLMAARDLEYIPLEDFKRLNIDYIGLTKGLNNFISAIKNKKS